MKKVFFIAFIFLGAVSGWWLAQGNKELFEALGVIRRSQEERFKWPSIDESTITLGLETWQVKDVFGPPDERTVETAVHGTRKEQWRYGDKWLYFTDGVLTSWQDGPDDREIRKP